MVCSIHSPAVNRRALFLLIVSVDVVCRPLLTLVLFNLAKHAPSSGAILLREGLCVVRQNVSRVATNGLASQRASPLRHQQLTVSLRVKPCQTWPHAVQFPYPQSVITMSRQNILHQKFALFYSAYIVIAAATCCLKARNSWRGICCNAIAFPCPPRSIT